MRILKESEINYVVEDIINEINNELGFSAIKVSDNFYVIKITSDYELSIDFTDNIKVELSINNESIDLSEGTSEVEALITACESAIEIVGIIDRMTSEGRS